MKGATLYLNRASHTLDFLPGTRSRFLGARSNLNTLDLAENQLNLQLCTERTQFEPGLKGFKAIAPAPFKFLVYVDVLPA